jgi:glycosyltransferase involved in cell wall biosynthesis
MVQNNDGSLIVFVDNQIIRRNNQGGIKRLFLELHRVSRRKVKGQVILNYQLRKSLLKSLKEIRLIAKKREVDIIQHTYYNPLYCFSHLGVPCVSVVHDMIPEKYSYYKLFHLRIFKKFYINKSIRIICVSQSTKKDLDSRYGNKLRSQVITLGGDHLLKQIEQKRSSNRLPYIVYVGKRKSYKNAIILFKSMGEIIKLCPEVKFIFVGGEKYNAKEKSLMKKYNMSIKVIKKIDDSDLANLLSKSAILVSTSMYEGFSLPIVEGASLGATVVASDNSAHLELKNNGLDIQIFSPEIYDDLVKKIVNVLNGKLDTKSQQQIKSWDEVYSEFVDFYESIDSLNKK